MKTSWQKKWSPLKNFSPSKRLKISAVKLNYSILFRHKFATKIKTRNWKALRNGDYSSQSLYQLLSRDITWIYDLRVMWLCEFMDYLKWSEGHVTLWIIVCHQKLPPLKSAKVDVNRPHESECNVFTNEKLSKDQIILWLVASYLEPPPCKVW